MKKLVTLFAALGLMASSAVLAGNGAYLAGHVGFADTDVDVQTAGNFSLDDGHTFGVALGYKMDAFRVEVETSRIKNDDLKNTNLMLNGYYDFDLNSPLTPYVGIGAGIAELKIESFDDDTVAAAQGIIGVSYALDDNLSVGADYRYMKTDTAKFSNTLKLKSESSLFNVGLRYTF